MRYLLAVVILCLSAARARADSVLLNNGDKITGQIDEVNPAAVIVSTEYAGRLTIQRSAVKSLQSTRAVSVFGEDGQRTQSFLSPAPGGQGWRVTDTPVSPRYTPFLAMGRGWKNQLAVGVVNTSGNDATTSLTGALNFHYERKPDEFTLALDGNYGVSNGTQNAGLLEQHGVYRHDLSTRWYAYADEESRYDAIKGISMEATGTTGLGYWFFRSDRFKLDLRAGPGLTYLQTFDGEVNINPAAGAALRAVYAINDRLSASQEVTYLSAVDDPALWNLQSTSALQMKLDVETGLGLKLAFTDSYDNQPSAGRKANDTRLTLSLTLDF